MASRYAMEGVTFVGIPFYTLAKYRGMGQAVEMLRKAGIVEQLNSNRLPVYDIGDIECPNITADEGPRHLKNFNTFLEGTQRISEGLAKRVKSSRVTLCLGGECSFIVGSLTALKAVHKGTPGVVWLDAHGDYNTPETSPSGFVGGMPLAIACGLGPELTPDLEKQRPLVDPHNVVHIGSRSLDPGEEQNLRSQTTVYDAKPSENKLSKISHARLHTS